ncbi:MAG: DUF4097 family beta strand repeat protein [Lachnospiraceae bacterium]|nr:DUF4097 family beta strand repeat protein [Lachnospiraceae bacterium]
MNKVLKWVAISSAAVLALGVGILILGIALGGKLSYSFNYDDGIEFVELDNKKIVEDKVSINSFDELYVDTNSTDVTVKLGDENSVYYKLPEYLVPEITEENKKLSVVTKQNNDKSFVFMSFPGNYESFIVITADEDTLKKISVKTSSGDLNISDLSLEGSISKFSGDLNLTNAKGSNDIMIKSSSGDITVDNCDFTTVNIKQSSGDTEIKKVDCDYMEIVSSSGKNSLDDCNIEELNLDTSSGSKVVINSNIKKITNNGVSGSIELEKTQVQYIDSDTSSGGTRLNIIGNSDDYDYEIKVSSGDISIDGEEIKGHSYNKDNSAQNKIRIESSSGDVEIDFSEK